MPYIAKLNVIVPHELISEFLSKLHYISESLADFELTEERDAVRFQLKAEAEHKAATVTARIFETAQKMCRAHRPGGLKLIASRQPALGFDEDPHPLLEARGELFRFGQGRFGFGPRLLELMQFFDSQLVQQAERFLATSYQFPTLIGVEVLDRCKYLRSFPHSLSLVSHLREDLGAIQNFARTAHWEKESLSCDAEDLAAIKCMLSPNVCFHCYALLQDSCQTEHRAFTAVGKCFRYESGNLGGLERLWDFTMREWIFVGMEEYVLEQRQRAIEETIKLLDEWNLIYEIKSATDPFFIEEYSIAMFQLAFDLKYEIQASLPYKAGWLAIGSFNYHQDLFGRSLNITDAKGEAINTSCVGFGLERLALAFLAQHGLNPKKWPAAVADNLRTW